jgi:hypothetical protein
VFIDDIGRVRFRVPDVPEPAAIGRSSPRSTNTLVSLCAMAESGVPPPLPGVDMTVGNAVFAGFADSAEVSARPPASHVFDDVLCRPGAEANFSRECSYLAPDSPLTNATQLRLWCRGLPFQLQLRDDWMLQFDAGEVDKLQDPRIFQFPAILSVDGLSSDAVRALCARATPFNASKCRVAAYHETGHGVSWAHFVGPGFVSLVTNFRCANTTAEGPTPAVAGPPPAREGLWRDIPFVDACGADGGTC